MTAHHKGLYPFVGLLVFAIVFLVGSLVASERECDRLRKRVAELEAEAAPPHMLISVTEADGTRRLVDPNRPWLKHNPFGTQGRGEGR